MPDELYGDDGPTMAEERSPDAKKPEHSDDDQKTYLINSEVCPGMKPGDEMVVRIVDVHDKEYEVAYSPEEGKDKEKEGGGDESMAPEAPASGMDGGSDGGSMYG